MEKTSDIKCTVRYLREGFFDAISQIIDDLLAHSVMLRLVSKELDPVTNAAKVSGESKLRLRGGKDEDTDSLVTISFTVDKDFGTPGAVLLESFHSHEFYLKSITLYMPDNTNLYFPCHTWINHSKLYFGKPRVFFANQPYLPNETPAALAKLREEDLSAIRGDGTDPASEQPQTSFDGTYVPRDERFSALKKEQFIAVGARSVGHNVLYSLEKLLMDNRSFEALEEIYNLYVGDLKAPFKCTSKPTIKKPTDGTPLQFPAPGVVEANKEAWKTDLEFGRQRLAGLNPVVIQRLQSFPPTSSLDPQIYGQTTSSFTAHHLEPLLEGLSVKQALDRNLLYILDYHDALMPYINKINELKEGRTYASRTIFYLTRAGELVPIAIELTLPPTQKGEKAKSRVFTSPSKTHVCSESPWNIAKTHVAIVDTGYHQLVSHWLRTHACIEPIVIATRRHLSSMHPLHILLSPHFKDTLHINALARSSLINAGGKIETHYTPGQYCMEISSAMYKGWRFDEEALPKDLLKRGMAVEDKSSRHGVRLTIKDYPYAVDGLDLWGAIRQWVQDYVILYYKDDGVVQDDVELQRWWQEVKEVGHGDHAGADWWSKLKEVDDVVEVMATIIWMASALHAAVNFGQYAYGGYMPNSPCMSRCLIPEEETPEYAKMLTNPVDFFLDTVPTQGATTLAMAVLEILAQHMSEEEYLGERRDVQWTCDPSAVAALETFRRNLTDVEAAITRRNADQQQAHHRVGKACLPYTLLAPSSAGPGLTFRGVPNSISI